MCVGGSLRDWIHRMLVWYHVSDRQFEMNINLITSVSEREIIRMKRKKNVMDIASAITLDVPLEATKHIETCGKKGRRDRVHISLNGISFLNSKTPISGIRIVLSTNALQINFLSAVISSSLLVHFHFLLLLCFSFGFVWFRSYFSLSNRCRNTIKRVFFPSHFRSFSFIWYVGWASPL